MNDSFITQCPHCRTSFRVKREQLTVARGAVRCGACLQVFNAAQQLLGQVDTPDSPAFAEPQASTARPTGRPREKADDTRWIHDDLDLSDLDLDEELAKLEQQEQAARLARQQTAAVPLQDAPLARPPAPAEASVDDALSPKVEPVITEPGLSAPAPLARENDAEPDDLRDEPPLSLHSRDDAGEEVEAPASEPAEPTVSLSADVEHPFDPPPPLQRRKTATGEPPLRGERLQSLREEPIQLGWQRPKKRWGRRIGWLTMNVLGLLALLGQYVWYHFDEVARDDRFRPWFEVICPNVGCTLPSKVDTSQIRSSNLTVRSHPDFSGALVVDAILYNRAPFAQPFPSLELRFADLNGRLIASRSFKPSEYLSGELAGRDEMPPQTPIHIALEILDPGPKAVNYSLSFHSPE
jgi:predicted Zn finger-like uncharacterized protein